MTVVQVWNILRATRKKHLELRARGAKTRTVNPGADLGEGAGGAPPPPRGDLRFSNTTGIPHKKKTMWFIGVEVEQETSAPPPKKKSWIRP